MIEDKEMCELFKLESDEHLSLLENGLMRLEQQPDDRETLQEMFREAHSLKGAARMLGVFKVMEAAHALEDLFGKAHRGDITFSTTITDRIYPVVDAIRKFVREATCEEAVAGTLEVKSVLEYLKLEQEAPPPKSAIEGKPVGAKSAEESPLIPPDTVRQPNVIKQQTTAEEQPPISTPYKYDPGISQPVDISKSRLETIRVDPRKMDSLMIHAGELAVTKTSIMHRFKEINSIIAYCEDWYSDVFSRQMLLKELIQGQDALSKALTDFFNLEQSRFERLKNSLNDLKTGSFSDNTRLESVAKKLQYEIRNVSILPIKTLFRLFPKMVKDIAKTLSKSVRLVIEGGETTVDRQIIEELKDPIMHLIRNAIDHGIDSPQERLNSGKAEMASIVLRAYKYANQIVVEVEDDGRGLDTEAIKKKAIKEGLCTEDQLQGMTDAQVHALIFTPGLSTSSIITDVSGRGIGLDVVTNKMEGLKGSVRVESVQCKGCLFRLKMPVTMTTTRVLVVSVLDKRFAIPVEFIAKSFMLAQKDIFKREGRDTMRYDDQPVSLALLSELLELKTSKAKDDRTIGQKQGAFGHGLPDNPFTCLIIATEEQKAGVIVDSIIDEQEVVLKRYSTILQRVKNISGAAILETGEVCAILNPLDLIKSALKRKSALITEKFIQQQPRNQSILLVEDTITTRTLIKRILEGAAYEVSTAIDGLDALNKLTTRDFDAVVSDVQMPNMDGLTLAENIRMNKKYKELPIVLITALSSEEDKKRGMKAGANAYITKPTFDHKVLIDVLRRLI
ncbi:MAG: hybrid sensor histidine kinase/response regulator [Nitrospirae bacterium]|nr:hybrid sensor histidine kinase/response regulator [Nitrospirota bacterium]